MVGLATDGGWNTVDQAFHSGFAAAPDEFMFFGGPVRRWVSESTPHGIRAQSSLPGGVSGDASSPYYTNLLAGWLTNDTFEQTLQRGAIMRGALSVTHYRP